MSGFDDATWQALGLVLTLLGLGTSAFIWMRRGAVSGLRAVAWSLLPLAAGLTGTLRLAWDIVDSVGTWAARLVFSPVVWLGIVLAGVSVVLFGASAVVRGRQPADPRKVSPSPKRRPAAGPADVEGMDDIEAILRKHGIS